MKVLLIVPPFKSNDNYMPSLGIYILASVLKENNYIVEIIDFSYELRVNNKFYSKKIYEKCAKKIIDTNSDFLCFSCNSVTILPAVNICKILKNKINCPIIIGGPIATTNSEEIIAYECIDYVISGEGENSLLQLINSINKKSDLSLIKNLAYKIGKKIKINEKEELSDLSFYNIIPSYELMPSEENIKKINAGKVFIPIEIGRGCTFDCAFCSSKLLWHGKTRYFKKTLIIDQLSKIKELYKDAILYITCDNILYNYDFFLEVIKEIKKNNLRWQCRARLDSDKIDFSVLKKSGCDMQMIGIESPNESTLKLINKKIDLLRVYQKICYLSQIGIGTTITFIIGFPFENKNDIINTIKYAARLLPLNRTDVYIHALTPISKTKITNKFNDIHFNGGTNLVSGIKFNKKINKVDKKMIKSNKKLFISYYSFKNSNYNNINKLSEFTNLLFKLHYYSNISCEILDLKLLEYSMTLNLKKFKSYINKYLLNMKYEKNFIHNLNKLFKIEYSLFLKKNYVSSLKEKMISKYLSKNIFCFIVDFDINKILSKKNINQDDLNINCEKQVLFINVKNNKYAIIYYKNLTRDSIYKINLILN